MPRLGSVRFRFGRFRFGPVPVRSGSGSIPVPIRFFYRKIDFGLKRKIYLQRGKAAFPPPCFLENRGLEGVWAPPWGVLEGSGRLLGGSWLQEASWVFCRLLSGGSWAAQEPSWGPRWTQVEGQDGSKILPRRPKMCLRCLQDCPRSDFQSKSKEK